MEWNGSSFLFYFLKKKKGFLNQLENVLMHVLSGKWT